MDLKVTNPHLEFLCVLHEETGHAYITQFHKPRSTHLENYFRQWAGSKGPGIGKSCAGRFCASITVLADGKFIVVEEGFFKLTA